MREIYFAYAFFFFFMFLKKTKLSESTYYLAFVTFLRKPMAQTSPDPNSHFPLQYPEELRGSDGRQEPRPHRDPESSERQGG